MKLNNTHLIPPVWLYIDMREVFYPQIRQVSLNRKTQNYEREIKNKHSLISLVIFLSRCLNI